MWDTCGKHVNTCFPHVNLCVHRVLFQFHIIITFEPTCDITCDIMWPHGKFSAAVCATWDIMCAYVMLCGPHVWRCGHMWPTRVTMWAYVAHMCHAWPTCATNIPHVCFMWASEPTWDPHDATCHVVWEHFYTRVPHVGLKIHINSHVSVSCGVIIAYIYLEFNSLRGIYCMKTFVLSYIASIGLNGMGYMQLCMYRALCMYV